MRGRSQPDSTWTNTDNGLIRPLHSSKAELTYRVVKDPWIRWRSCPAEVEVEAERCRMDPSSLELSTEFAFHLQDRLDSYLANTLANKTALPTEFSTLHPRDAPLGNLPMSRFYTQDIDGMDEIVLSTTRLNAGLGMKKTLEGKSD
jgi:hypothetical protein